MRSGLFSVALAFGLVGCAANLKGHADMEHPLAAAEREDSGSVVSDGIAIPTKDPEVIAFEGTHAPRTQGGALRYNPTFYQTAVFEMVTPDRVDFMVELQHRNADYADPREYQVWLEDDAGHRVSPVHIEGTPLRAEKVTMNLGRVGIPVMQVRAPGMTYVMRVSEDSDRSMMIQRRRSLLTFEGRGLIRPETKRLSLVLRNDHRTLRFTWNFL